MDQDDHTPDLAVGICTQDNIRTIERTVRSVTGLARRIVVVDSGSTDGTIELCRSLGAEVIEREWPGMPRQRQFLLDECANHRWVLLLDSDESLEPDLCESIRRTVTADDPARDGWELHRKVYFLGGWLHHTFQPEWRLRLMRGGVGSVRGVNSQSASGAVLLHDDIQVPGAVGRLDGILRHDSWIDLTDMFQRYVRYGRQMAEYGAKGGSLASIVFSPPGALIKQYIIKRGFLDGRRGLIAAGGAAAGTLIKHIFIARHRAGLGKEET